MIPIHFSYNVTIMSLLIKHGFSYIGISYSVDKISIIWNILFSSRTKMLNVKRKVYKIE